MLKQTFFRGRCVVLAALLAGAVCSAAQAAEPEVLSKVPADAYGLVVINNVRTLSNKISNAGTRLSLTMPPDIAGYITRQIGITKGFDANSSAAVVLLKPSAERLAQGYFNGAPPAVMLLPTSDAKGMLEPFNPGAPDKSGISQVTLPEDPTQKGFVVVVDNKWIALATNREDIEAYVARGDSFAAKASAETRKVFDTNDLVIWGNVPKLGFGADKLLDDAQIDFGGMMELANVANNLDPFAAAMQKQSVGMVFAFAKEFLKDADASMLTLRLTDSGATAGLVGDFKSNSPIGKFVAMQKGAKAVSLAGLPGATGGNFLMAGAAAWDPASMTVALDGFADAILNDPVIAKDPRGGDFRKAIELDKQLMAITTGASIVLLDPPAGGKNGLFSGAMLFDTTDPEKFGAVETQLFTSALAQNDTINPDFKQSATVTPNAVTIKGVSLNKVSIKVALREETPDKPISQPNHMAFEMMQKLYGPEGLTAYTGVIGKRGIMIYGSDAPTLEAAVTAAQNNADNLSSNPVIAATKDQLVANPVAVAYLPLTRWVTLAQSLIRPNAGDVPLPPAIVNAPPIVMSAGVSGNMMTAEIHVPIATISGVQEAYTRMMRALGGGGGAGQLP